MNKCLLLFFLSQSIFMLKAQNDTLAINQVITQLFEGMKTGDSNLIEKPSSLNVLNEINLLKKDSIKKLNHFVLCLGVEILSFKSYSTRSDFYNESWPSPEKELAKRFISNPTQNFFFENYNFFDPINFTYSVSYNVKNKFIYSLGGSYSNNSATGNLETSSAYLKVFRTNVYFETDYVLSKKNNFKRKLYFGLRLAGTHNIYDYNANSYKRFLPGPLEQEASNPIYWRSKEVMLSSEANYISIHPALGFTSFKHRFFTDFGIHFNTITYVNGSYSYNTETRHPALGVSTNEKNNNKLNMFFFNNTVVYDVYFKVGFRFKSKNTYLQKKKKG